MGMFDDLKCLYPLPEPWMNLLNFQTKSGVCYMDRYEIREDGTLWHENYEVEDRSKIGKWLREHPGEQLPEELTGLDGFIGCRTRINEHWVQQPLTGEMRFYTPSGKEWIEFSAYFVDGKLKELHRLQRDKS